MTKVEIKEQIEEIETAIKSILSGGASYTIGNRTITKANINDLFNEENRMIDVYWFDDVNGSYKVEVEILANDRNGLLRDVIKQVENYNKIKLMGVNTRTTKESIAIMNISLEVENIEILTKLINAFRNIESVYEVHRKRG